MNALELKALLEKLNGELTQAQPIPADLHSLLKAVSAKIEAHLDQSDLPSEQSNDPTLEDQARAIETRFAADHPYLVSTLNDAIDRLGKMGI